MNNIKLFKILLSCVIFTVLFLITVQYIESIPYNTKNITDYVLNIEDKPFKKETSAYADLSINLLIFLSIFIFIKKKFSNKINFNLQIICMTKSFISLFLAMIYETYFGLDQTQYFSFVTNDVQYAYHFGYLDKFFDFKNSTVNFLLPLKFVNFIFSGSWFAQKNFQNILYFISLIYFYKTLILINPKLKDNLSILYFYGLTPSFLFVSSFITKDYLIISLLSILVFNVVNLIKTRVNLTNILTIILIMFLIFSMRWWIAAGIFLACIVYFTYSILSKVKFFNFNFEYFILFFTLFGLYSLLYTFNYNQLEFEVLTKLYGRVIAEHFYSPVDYQTLFINSGTKFELLLLYPVALAQTIFNPFIEKITNLKLLIFVIENFILFVLLILSFKNIKQYFNRSMMFVILLTIIFAHIYIPAGYLNSGTTLRYAIQIKYLFLIYLVQMNSVIFIKTNKLISQTAYFQNLTSKK